jgi:hypothetical protein
MFISIFFANSMFLPPWKILPSAGKKSGDAHAHITRANIILMLHPLPPCKSVESEATNGVILDKPSKEEEE